MKFYNFVTRALNVFCKVFYRVRVIGMENIPDEGRIILAANHKSNLDAVLIAGCIRKRKLVALAKEELNNNKIMAHLVDKLGVITINRDNPGASSVKRILKALKNEEALVVFPEGTRVKGDEFGEAKQGLTMFAHKGKSNVVPVSIITNYKLFSKVTIYIDKPVSLEEYYGVKLSGEEQLKLAQDIMEIIKNNYNTYKFK